MEEGLQTTELINIIKIRLTQPEFETAIYTRFDIRVQNIARTSLTFPIAILDVIDYFRSKRNLGEFFDALEAAHPVFVPLFAPHRAVAPDPRRVPDRLRSLSVGTSPRFLFVNRTELRKHLRDISTPGKDLRVLSVNGTVSCGKTYSWHLIRDVAKTLGSEPVYLDLSRLALQDAFRKIAKLLTLDWAKIEGLISADTKPARAVMLFWEEVGAMSRNLPKPYWLILDGLSSPSIDRDIWNLLIPQLLEEIPMNPMPNIFPVLIGDSAKRVEAVKRHTVHEDITGLSEDEIEKFIADWCKEQGYSNSPKTWEKAASQIVADVPPAIEDRKRFDVIRKNLEIYLQKLAIIHRMEQWCLEKNRSMTAEQMTLAAEDMLSKAPADPDDFGWQEVVQDMVTKFLEQLERTQT